MGSYRGTSGYMRLDRYDGWGLEEEHPNDGKSKWKREWKTEC